MMFIGVDPGVGGGIAVLDEAGHVLETHKMPETERDLLDVFLTYEGYPLGQALKVRAVLERVAASPQMGVVSAFTFGRGIGALRMALTAARIPFDEATPGKWQTALGCRTGGDKNISKRRAQQLFPSIKVTHAIADALLLAEYCRRIHRSSSSEDRRVGANNVEEEGNRVQPGKSEEGARGVAAEEGRRQPFEGWVPKGRTRRSKGTAQAGAPRASRGGAAGDGGRQGSAPGGAVRVDR